MGLDRIRSSVEGLEEIELALDWSKVRLIPIIADEKIQFSEGSSSIVSIKPIKIPAYSMVFNSYYGVNGMGHASCIGALTFKKPSEDFIRRVSALLDKPPTQLGFGEETIQP